MMYTKLTLNHSRKTNFCANIGYGYIFINFSLMSSFVSLCPTQGHPIEPFSINLDTCPTTWTKERFNKGPHSKCILIPLHALLSHPYFGQVWGWSPTLGKVGSWSPPGLPNVQSSTIRPKTPRLGVFLVSLERSRSVNVQNGLALVIWTSVAQVMGKRRAGSQIGSLTPDH